MPINPKIIHFCVSLNYSFKVDECHEIIYVTVKPANPIIGQMPESTDCLHQF